MLIRLLGKIARLGEALRIAGALLLFTFMSRALGMYTLIPRIGAMLTAVTVVQLAPELSLLRISQAYAAAFACYYLIALLLWLGLQSRLQRAA